MTILLSIKPEFTQKIFNGTKCFEYRKVIPRKKNLQKVIVYASAPVSKVIGEFQVEDIIENEPNQLWKDTKTGGGITAEFFFSYFKNRNKGYALKIVNPILYEEEQDIKKSYGISAPQSFVYV